MCRKTKEITHQLIQFQANQTLTFLETEDFTKKRNKYNVASIVERL